MWGFSCFLFLVLTSTLSSFSLFPPFFVLHHLLGYLSILFSFLFFFLLNSLFKAKSNRSFTRTDIIVLLCLTLAHLTHDNPKARKQLLSCRLSRGQGGSERGSDSGREKGTEGGSGQKELEFETLFALSCILEVPVPTVLSGVTAEEQPLLIEFLRFLNQNVAVGRGKEGWRKVISKGGGGALFLEGLRKKTGEEGSSFEGGWEEEEVERGDEGAERKGERTADVREGMKQTVAFHNSNAAAALGGYFLVPPFGLRDTDEANGPLSRRMVETEEWEEEKGRKGGLGKGGRRVGREMADWSVLREHDWWGSSDVLGGSYRGLEALVAGMSRKRVDRLIERERERERGKEKERDREQDAEKERGKERGKDKEKFHATAPCSRCGYTLPFGWRFCNSCGLELRDDDG